MNIAPLNFLSSINKIQTTPKQGIGFSSYAQKPDTFERSCAVNFTANSTSNKTENYNKIIKTLKLTNENALTSLNGQIASDGWAGKTADWVSGAWHSKNRAHLVKADIDTYNNQVQELNNAIKDNKFEKKFREIFGVKYNQKLIDSYAKKAEEFKLAVTTKCMADITEEKLEKSLNIFKDCKGKLQDKIENKIIPMATTGSVPIYKEVKPKKEILKEFEIGLEAVLGSKERLVATAKSSGVDLTKATDDQKYKAYGALANFLIETSKSTAKKCSGGKTLEQLDTEYEETYAKAYGTKNDIQSRVDKYNRSQEIGAASIRGVVRSGLVAIACATAGVGGISGIAVGAGATFGAKVAVEISDKMTNDIDDSVDLSKESLGKMARSAAISSADYIVSRGLKNIIPDVDTSSDIWDFVIKNVKDNVIDTSTGMVAEYFKQGKWNVDQIVPRILISAVFSNLGKDNPITDQLMRLTKGGVNQAMKKKHRDYDAVREFVNGVRIILDEDYIKDSKKFADIKLFATKQPEKFEEYMIAVLQSEIDKKAEVVKA